MPAGKLIHAILDNYAAHKPPKVMPWLARHLRWTSDLTPTSCSPPASPDAGRGADGSSAGCARWLNLAEIEFSALTRDLPDRVGYRPTPERHMAARARGRSGASVAADGRFTTADPRARLRNLHPTIDG